MEIFQPFDVRRRQVLLSHSQKWKSELIAQLMRAVSVRLRNETGWKRVEHVFGIKIVQELISLESKTSPQTIIQIHRGINAVNDSRTGLLLFV